MNMKEIAEKAGVSVATVSYVLNGRGKVGDKTREEILKIVGEEGYSPNKIAQSLRTRKTNTIGILVEDITAFQTPRIIDGIDHYAEKNGYQVLLNNLGLLEKVGKDFEAIVNYNSLIHKGIHIFEKAQVDGIIYIALHDRDISNLNIKCTIPIVYVYAYDTSNKNFCVMYDNKKVTEELTQYLIEKKHTEIGIICGAEDSKPAHKRFEAFKKCLEENALKIDRKNIYQGDWEVSTGRAAYEQYKKTMCKPTAIFAMNDLMAVGFIDAALDDGVKIPEELSIVGFDNREMCNYIRPKLATVDLPLERMGREAGRIIVDLLNEKEVGEKNIVLACLFIKNKSITENNLANWEVEK